MTETKLHRDLKIIIIEALENKGFVAKEEHRIGKRTYDICAWTKEGKIIYIEVYLHRPPNHNFTEPNIRCQFCGYAWKTESDKMFVSCPSCLKKTKKEIGRMK